MKKGFAMITVLAIVIVIALTVATVLQSVASQTNIKSNNLQEVKSRYLAEAGMQHALWQCRTNAGVCADFAGFTITVDGIAVPVPIDVTLLGTSTDYAIEVKVNYTNV